MKQTTTNELLGNFIAGAAMLTAVTVGAMIVMILR
jgi:hypothetical protein